MMLFQLAFSATTNISFIISIFFFLSLIKLFIKRSKDRNLPPGPWKLPIIGSIHHLAIGTLPEYTLRKSSKRYGPVMHLKLGEMNAVVISSPQMAKLFMITHEDAFLGKPSTLATDIFSYNKSEIAFSPYNSQWKQMRKICVTELLSNKRVKSYSSIREDEVSNLVAFIRSSVGSPVNLTAQVFSLTSSVTCSAAFGEKFLHKNSLLSLVTDIPVLMGGFSLCDFFPSLKFLAVVSGMKSKLQKIHKKMDLLLENIINTRREYNRDFVTSRNQKEDLLDVLLRLQQQMSKSFLSQITTSKP